jgi:hypothetical protein
VLFVIGRLQALQASSRRARALAVRVAAAPAALAEDFAVA